MGLLQKIGGMIMDLFRNDAEKAFSVESITSSEMEKAQDLWAHIIKGTAPWMEKDIHSIKFANFICTYTAKKICQDISVNVTGSIRADFINKIVQNMVKKVIRDKVEDALGMGGIMLKPNGNALSDNAIDYVMPWNYVITEQTNNGDILGAIFFDRIQKGDTFYTRLEYHHFIEGSNDEGLEGRFYVIENKAYKSMSESTLGHEMPLNYIEEWALMEPVVTMTKIEKPLFAYFKMPYNNIIDYSSPEGVAIFHNCIEELKNLDVAWSRKSEEVEDSQHITFIDESTLKRADGRKLVRLPRFVRGIRHGVDSKSTIDEHVATLLTEQRIADINSILSMISTKAGFSQGQFILDRKTGALTATQIESDDNETVETINDIRNCLKGAIKDLIYALDKYCDLVYDIPDGYVNALDDKVSDEDIFYFKDLMATFEQDRQRAYQLMTIGKYSTKKYLMEYEGFSEDEVESMMEDIKSEKNSNASLFAVSE